MLKHIIKMPNRYYQGDGIARNLRNYTKYLGDSCVVVISARGYDRFKDLIKEHLIDAGVSVEYSIPGTTTKIDTKAKFVIGMGGGSIIDEAKHLSHRCNLPCVVIPTALSSDASCNSIIVPKSYDDKDTMIIRANKNPEMVIADTTLLKDSPINLAKSGIGDALSTYFEAISSYRSTGYTMTHGQVPESFIAMADYLYKKLLRVSRQALMYMGGDVKYKEQFDELVCAILYESSILSENCGLSIPHAFSLACDEAIPNNNILHGYKVAFGTLFHLYLIEDSKNFKYVDEFLKDLDIPNSLSGLGIQDSNSIMRIAESIISNKLSMNIPSPRVHLSAPLIYNHLMKFQIRGNNFYFGRNFRV